MSGLKAWSTESLSQLSLWASVSSHKMRALDEIASKIPFRTKIFWVKMFFKLKSIWEFLLWHSGFTIWLVLVETPTNSGLKDPELSQLWNRSRLWLGWFPGLGTSICHRGSRKRKKKLQSILLLRNFCIWRIWKFRHTGILNTIPLSLLPPSASGITSSTPSVSPSSSSYIVGLSQGGTSQSPEELS